MTHVIVDVESDGKQVARHSMIAIGAVVLTEDGVNDNKFHGLLRPIGPDFEPEALAVSGFTRQETLEFPTPYTTMAGFLGWLSGFSSPYTFWSDNPAYDWKFTDWYCHEFLGDNPFGFSARRIGDLYCGSKGDIRAGWKHLRKTRHTHNPTDDATGNGEALWKILQGMRGVKW